MTYAGDVSAKECWTALASDPNSALIDVRTDAEWSYVGAPDLSSIAKKPLMVPWQVFPKMAPNPEFAAVVAQAIPDRGRNLYFLCRSGARSRPAAAAMTSAGYERCFNIVGGFEGDLDQEKHRGRKNGWKAEGLPWIQS